MNRYEHWVYRMRNWVESWQRKKNNIWIASAFHHSAGIEGKKCFEFHVSRSRTKPAQSILPYYFLLINIKQFNLCVYFERKSPNHHVKRQGIALPLFCIFPITSSFTEPKNQIQDQNFIYMTTWCHSAFVQIGIHFDDKLKLKWKDSTEVPLLYCAVVRAGGIIKFP